MPTVLDVLPANPGALASDISAETRLGQAMRSAIQRGDETQAAQVLGNPGTVACEGLIRSVWLPLAEEFARDGTVFDGAGDLGHLVRQKIRNVLLKEADIPVVYWLVPAKRSHITAAHLAALVLTRRATGARVWQWPMPVLGSFLTIGGGGGRTPDDGHIPIHGETRSWSSLAALVA